MADGDQKFSWDDEDKKPPQQAASAGGGKKFSWDDEPALSSRPAALPASAADQNPNLPGATPALIAAVKAGKTPGAPTQPSEQEKNPPDYLGRVWQKLNAPLPRPAGGGEEEEIRTGAPIAAATLGTVGMAGAPIEAIATRSVEPLIPLVRGAIGAAGGGWIGREAGRLIGLEGLGGELGGLVGGLYGVGGGKIPTSRLGLLEMLEGRAARPGPTIPTLETEGMTTTAPRPAATAAVPMEAPRGVGPATTSGVPVGTPAPPVVRRPQPMMMTSTAPGAVVPSVEPMRPPLGVGPVTTTGVPAGMPEPAPTPETAQRAEVTRDVRLLRRPEVQGTERAAALDRLRTAEKGLATPSIPSIENVVNQATGAQPLQPNVPLREQIPALRGAAAEAETDPLKIKYPDPAVRQMVRANGENIVQAVGDNPELMKNVHDLNRVDLRQALINSGEDMGQRTVSNSRFAGPGGISREAAFNRLLEKGHSPQDIVDLAKRPIAKPEALGPEETTEKFFDPKTKTWTSERAANHQAIIDDAFRGKVAPADRAPEATITMGGSGAGKSTLTRPIIAGNPNVVDINSDAIKLRIPEFEGLKRSDPSKAAFRVHEESSQIAKDMVRQAVRKGLDFAFDTTTGGGGEALYKDLKDAGYRVKLLYADAPTEEAIRRANLRVTQSADPANRGRVVPEDVIRQKHTEAAQAFLKHMDSPNIDEVNAFDTTSRTPARFYSRGTMDSPQGRVYNEDVIERVRGKAGVGREKAPATETREETLVER
jgi:predicted ABC-type ATPase